MNDLDNFLDASQPCPARTQALLRRLIDEGFSARINEHGEIHFQFSAFFLRIDSRPAYCDRGRWLLHAESKDPSVATVDNADRFPRYYFNDEALVMELLSWQAARLAHITRRGGN